MAEPVAPSQLPPLPCAKCGHNLRAIPREGVCPECGTPVDETLGLIARQREKNDRENAELRYTKILAWLAPLLGLLGLVLVGISQVHDCVATRDRIAQDMHKLKANFDRISTEVLEANRDPNNPYAGSARAWELDEPTRRLEKCIAQLRVASTDASRAMTFAVFGMAIAFLGGIEGLFSTAVALFGRHSKLPHVRRHAVIGAVVSVSYTVLVIVLFFRNFFQM